ncbi:hypothetical protein [Neisseria chenwenguii]|uniref:Uncharacterized protein n=1 Tax=Neisseria chenwenguii TaxID=1853278 RepID=A0A220RZG3_9NEIS|nr:hypothetical protein [Neisseria chenwenguii]ASK26594.1 hypothetical protein BG910_01500 [Neisseria chenwenguii]ROV55393.1 hypothetical protein EGS38_10125 [Neisseria chenwenguii]
MPSESPQLGTTANRIDTDIKGRLRIESAQDHIEQENSQSNAGVRAQISFGTAWEAKSNRTQAPMLSESPNFSASVGWVLAPTRCDGS